MHSGSCSASPSSLESLEKARLDASVLEMDVGVTPDLEEAPPGTTLSQKLCALLPITPLVIFGSAWMTGSEVSLPEGQSQDSLSPSVIFGGPA
mmetsp:Transcript_27904/g.52308  ORF Transcript_27904/g.52308 Transcript_27904/m.52308 type:complete len:93 (-) Transcript_27904:49-327(-)